MWPEIAPPGKLCPVMLPSPVAAFIASMQALDIDIIHLTLHAFADLAEAYHLENLISLDDRFQVHAQERAESLGPPVLFCMHCSLPQALAEESVLEGHLYTLHCGVLPVYSKSLYCRRCEVQGPPPTFLLALAMHTGLPYRGHPCSPHLQVMLAAHRKAPRMGHCLHASMHKDVLIGITGLCFTVFSPQNGVRYSGIFLLNVGSSGCIPNILAYSTKNVVGSSKRQLSGFPISAAHKSKSVDSMLTVVFGGVGGIIASTVYREKDFPRYLPGLWVTLSVRFLLLFLVWEMTLYFTRLNRLSRAGKLAGPLEGQVGFFYTL
ncbi:hypothetical protein DFH08DRAFT_799939 [Mycena albidolilacea]|uniref:CxC5 like cysteine cluster associated with KDZ domain-containing protein n=1 Tax=Mycena albidolilacea TaxID=1033008 RepID=A0AAD7AMK9_9AGAR|nr:hypothetical protein DFH08DRAFT_799939 [Mycena albidolilacea]